MTIIINDYRYRLMMLISLVFRLQAFLAPVRRKEEAEEIVTKLKEDRWGVMIRKTLNG
jgi:hypothetical protein